MAVADTLVRFAAAGFSLVIAIAAFQRRRVPGSLAFGWLELAVAFWCATSGLHHAVDSLPEKLAISRVQYLGISAAPPLCFLFARAYAHRGAPAPAWLWTVWIVPALTASSAFTNDWHHLLWTAVVPAGAGPVGSVDYLHGPWFFVAAAHSYLLLGAGTWQLIQAQQRYPSQYRAQTAALMIGAAIPWIGNILYVTGFIGQDLTPVAFTASGIFIAWGMFRRQLFDLVPIARDMLFDSLSDAVFVLDPQNRILDMNAPASALAGGAARPGQLITGPLPWWRPLSAADGHAARPPITVEIGDRSFDVAVQPVREERTSPSGWLVVMHDVTDRMRSEAERRTLERRLLEQQHVESLSVLTGGLAHDFNNLLAGVIGNADLLLMQTHSPDLREPLGTILHGAERAAELVAKMLAYAGEGRVIPERLDLVRIVREMVDLVSHSAARHCTIVSEPAGVLPQILADSTQVRQVILNLLVNAAEATGDAGVITVRTGVEPLSLETLHLLPLGDAAAPGDFLFIEVEDTGRGMDADTVARAFDPFFTTKPTGSGLGLASVHGILRGHHGALRVTSAPGAGSVFRVWLPVVDTTWPVAAPEVPRESYH